LGHHRIADRDVERLIDEATAHLVLNLGGVPFMDSAGLAPS
jgi:anti-anti-sigma regulatory factor